MFCYHCMRQLPHQAAYCPFCGEKTGEANPPHCLPAGTELHGKFIVGNVLGIGGFGITYVGFDKMLELKVAVKEYYPSGAALRDSTHTNEVTFSQTKETEYFRRGKENFLKEARSIAKFTREDGIVDVREYFTENNTAYIVMEFLEGMNLGAYIRQNGRMEPQQAFDKMLPVMHTLAKMHRQQIIHRDISPANIMVSPDGKLTLMDFGSARRFSMYEDNTMSILLKLGYSPLEQYSRKGNQGPWTDVYSLCATLYYWITGETPPDALDRNIDDDLQPPSALGVAIPARLEAALMQGLAIKPDDRLQSMDELIEATTAPEPVLELFPESDERLTQFADEPDVETPEKAVHDKDNEREDVSERVRLDTTEAIFKDSPQTNKRMSNDPEKNRRLSKPKIAIGIIAVLGIIGILTFFVLGIISGAFNKSQTSAENNTTINKKNNSERLSFSQRDTALSSTISGGGVHTVALQSDGTVVATGDNDYGECNVSDWTDIVAVSAGYNCTVGLKKDRTVVATGDNSDEQCNVSGWKDIVAVSAGDDHTVGLKKDGTVVAIGDDFYGQCNVGDWRDIVAVSAGNHRTIGLKKDGTVVAIGYNYNGNCDVSDWTNIVAVSAEGAHTVGIKKDGTVVATGDNHHGQCDVGDWTDIVAVSAGGSHTIGLRKDGTVVATGDNIEGQCNVSDWTDIVAVSAGSNHTVGLKSDGTVVAVGFNGTGKCDVSSWENIKMPESYYDKLTFVP